MASTLPSLRVFCPQQLIGQQFTKALVRFQQAFDCHRAAIETTGVYPCLGGDVCFRFKLQIALAGVLAEISLERAFDIDRVRVMPFDQIAKEAGPMPAKPNAPTPPAFNISPATPSPPALPTV